MYVRGSYTRFSLEMLEKLPAPQRERARGLAGVELMERVRRTTPMSRVDLFDHLRLDDVLLEVLGEPGYRELCRRMTREFIHRPLMAPLTGLGRRLVAGDPAALLARLPLAWRLVFEGCGALEVTATSSTKHTVRLRDVPRAIVASRSFALGVIGTLEELLEYVDVVGTVTEIEPGRACEIAWQ